MLIKDELLPQCPQFSSNIPRFGEEPDKLTKTLPERNNTILMSVVKIRKMAQNNLVQVMTIQALGMERLHGLQTKYSVSPSPRTRAKCGGWGREGV